MSKPGKPYAHTKLARFLDRRVLELRTHKTQLEIATQAGFVSVNMISLLKSGASKLALDRVVDLAKALETDTAFLLRLALEQIDERLAELVMPVTRNEAAWLKEIRDASDDSDPSVTTKARRAIRGIFGK